MTTLASQITSLTVVYSIVYSGIDQRKHQSSASLAFVLGIHRDRWIPRTKGQLRGKCFHLMTSSCDVAAMHLGNHAAGSHLLGFCWGLILVGFTHITQDGFFNGTGACEYFHSECWSILCAGPRPIYIDQAPLCFLFFWASILSCNRLSSAMQGTYLLIWLNFTPSVDSNPGKDALLKFGLR